MEKSKFFNSAPGDPRIYQAADFADYFGSVLSTGLLHTDNNPALEVICEGTDLQTYVEPGKAIMEGYAYENTANLYLQHALPEATLDRIDRIVLRLDKRNQSRFIKLFVLQGEPAQVPIAPELTRDDFIYELSLAQIRVRANTSTLDSADLIDERLDEQLCGLVYSLISIPTSQFQDEWDNWFDTSTASFEQQFNDWFSQLQTDGYIDQSELDDLAGTGRTTETVKGNADALAAHQADDVVHITAEERTSWNAKETTDGARKKFEQTDFKVYKSGKDANGIFTTIEHKRADNTLAVKSVLSGGTSPNYTTRTLTYYATNGTTIEKTTTFTLSYDADGVLTSEV